MDTELPTLRARAPIGVRMALLLALTIFGCGGPDSMEGAGASPVPVRLHEVARVDRPAWIGLSGDVEPLRTANVGFMVPGLVTAVGPEEGDRVRQGDLLAELDPTDYELNLELAAAQR
ncbi:MAG: efflux RND transporter periplasmic adaptor subunit, partial [Gemmatimonadales bacterium]|nr:efflux RND transporter periplasmic adaptor subunit [Gemmatimonadales bacterium]